MAQLTLEQFEKTMRDLRAFAEEEVDVHFVDSTYLALGSEGAIQRIAATYRDPQGTRPETGYSGNDHAYFFKLHLPGLKGSYSAVGPVQYSSEQGCKIRQPHQIDEGAIEPNGKAIRIQLGGKSFGLATTTYSYCMTEEMKQYSGERIALLLELAHGLSNDELRNRIPAGFNRRLRSDSTRG